MSASSTLATWLLVPDARFAASATPVRAAERARRDPAIVPAPCPRVPSTPWPAPPPPSPIPLSPRLPTAPRPIPHPYLPLARCRYRRQQAGCSFFQRSNSSSTSRRICRMRSPAVWRMRSRESSQLDATRRVPASASALGSPAIGVVILGGGGRSEGELAEGTDPGRSTLEALVVPTAGGDERTCVRTQPIATPSANSREKPSFGTNRE